MTAYSTSMTVDLLMNRFRLASRGLFNQFFQHTVHDEEEWHAEERFEEVENKLFWAMVTAPANLANTPYGQEHPEISVRLRAGSHAPWMLNREEDSGYWDHPLAEFDASVGMRFVRFFDWDPRDFKDNRYVRAKVVSFPRSPEAVGKHVLIETQYVAFDLVSDASNPQT